MKNNKKFLTEIDQFLKNEEFDKSLLDEILIAGKMKGFFTFNQFMSIYEFLNEVYPDSVSEIVNIGYSVKNRKIPAFSIGDLSKFKRIERKEELHSFYKSSSF